MELKHAFTVPVDRPTAWAAFQDIASVAECFPGAAVTEADGDSFSGTVKVKLGPIAMQYAGSGEFRERDEADYRMVVAAKGRDKRGNGTAGADVTAVFTEEGDSATRVEMATELQVTGKPAQFGRGVMQDVSDKLLGQFLDCLQDRISPRPPPPPQQPAPADAVPAEPSQADEEQVPTPAIQPPAKEGAPGAAGGPSATDAIDLGATVLPVLARSYWKQAALALLVVVVLVRWLRR